MDNDDLEKAISLKQQITEESAKLAGLEDEGRWAAAADSDR